MLDADLRDQHERRFGAFSGRVISEWLDDGRNMQIVDTFAYCDPDGTIWVVPFGTVVNGASIPRLFWRAIGAPLEGRYRDASVVHDRYCETQERPWRDVHRMFYFAMRCRGTGWTMATIMYWAVRLFGPRW